MKNSKRGRPKILRLERADRAYPLKSHYTWTSIINLNGVTTNINATGVYFEIEFNQKASVQTEFAIDLDTPVDPMHLHCIGEIVRIQDKGGKKELLPESSNQNSKRKTPLIGLKSLFYLK